MQDGSLQAAVVGAGTMGTTLAKLMAAHGVKVTVVDTNPKVLEASRLNVGRVPRSFALPRIWRWRRVLILSSRA